MTDCNGPVQDDLTDFLTCQDDSLPGADPWAPVLTALGRCAVWERCGTSMELWLSNAPKPGTSLLAYIDRNGDWFAYRWPAVDGVFQSRQGGGCGLPASSVPRVLSALTEIGMIRGDEVTASLNEVSASPDEVTASLDEGEKTLTFNDPWPPVRRRWDTAVWDSAGRTDRCLRVPGYRSYVARVSLTGSYFAVSGQDPGNPNNPFTQDRADTPEEAYARVLKFLADSGSLAFDY